MVGKKPREEEEQTWGGYKEGVVNKKEIEDRRASWWKWSRGKENKMKDIGFVKEN